MVRRTVDDGGVIKPDWVNPTSLNKLNKARQGEINNKRIWNLRGELPQAWRAFLERCSKLLDGVGAQDDPIYTQVPDSGDASSHEAVDKDNIGVHLLDDCLNRLDQLDHLGTREGREDRQHILDGLHRNRELELLHKGLWESSSIQLRLPSGKQCPQALLHIGAINGMVDDGMSDGGVFLPSLLVDLLDVLLEAAQGSKVKLNVWVGSVEGAAGSQKDISLATIDICQHQDSCRGGGRRLLLGPNATISSLLL